jgi:hypothetical protein
MSYCWVMEICYLVFVCYGLMMPHKSFLSSDLIYLVTIDMFIVSFCCAIILRTLISAVKMWIHQRSLLMTAQGANCPILSGLMMQFQQLVVSMRYMKRITCPVYGSLIACLQTCFRNARPRKMKQILRYMFV